MTPYKRARPAAQVVGLAIIRKGDIALNQNQENNFETVYIRDEIAKCEDIDELKERIFPMIKTQQEQWARKINDIITESGLK